MAINSIADAGNTCPLCWENAGIVSKIIPINYTVRKAVYTCENRNCVYFVTDEIGNLQTFGVSNRAILHDSKTTFVELEYGNAASGASKAVLSPPPSTKCSSPSFLDHIFRSTEKDSAVESIMNELTTDLQNFMKNN